MVNFVIYCTLLYRNVIKVWCASIENRSAQRIRENKKCVINSHDPARLDTNFKYYIQIRRLYLWKRIFYITGLRTFTFVLKYLGFDHIYNRNLSTADSLGLVYELTLFALGYSQVRPNMTFIEWLPPAPSKRSPRCVLNSKVKKGFFFTQLLWHMSLSPITLYYCYLLICF